MTKVLRTIIYVSLVIGFAALSTSCRPAYCRIASLPPPADCHVSPMRSSQRTK